MRRRFFTPAPRRGQTELTGPDAEHLTRVLRVERGQRFELSDNKYLYLAEVETARKSLVTFRILEQLPVTPDPVELILLPALFKFDRFEWLIEKATELGVSGVRPWEATRTERGLAQASAKRLARWQKIALESSQQSRRARLPVIEPPVKLGDALQVDAAVRLLLDENPGAPPILSVLRETHSSVPQAALLLGPEGGFTDSERAQALVTGWQPCSFGPTILRAETAAIAALAIVRAALV
jgi:16S rRNA (uracil1498-N3)-methyltransferase